MKNKGKKTAQFEYIYLEKNKYKYVATIKNNFGTILAKGFGLCELEAINSLDNY